MGDSKLWFIISAMVFITFVTQMGALVGRDIISNAPDLPAIPAEPTWLDYVLLPIWNLGYFFQLMALSSSYAFVGVILGILFVGILWAIIELVRGV